MNLLQELRNLEQKVRQQVSSWHADKIKEVADDIERAGTDVAEAADVAGQPEVGTVVEEGVKVVEEVAKGAEKLAEPLPVPPPAPAPPAEPVPLPADQPTSGGVPGEVPPAPPQA